MAGRRSGLIWCILAAIVLWMAGQTSPAAETREAHKDSLLVRAQDYSERGLNDSAQLVLDELNALYGPAARIAALDSALVLAPDSVPLWMEKGAALALSQRWAEAQAAFDRVLALDSTRAPAWWCKGVALQEARQFAAALEAARQAVRYDSSSSDAWRLLESTLTSLERFDEALAANERYLQLNPRDVNDWQERGRLLLHVGKPDAALEALQRALQLAPDNPDLWLLCALAHSGQKNWTAVLNDQSQVVRLRPEKAWSWYRRARTKATVGDTTAMFADLAQAIQRDSSLAEKAAQDEPFQSYRTNDHFRRITGR